MWFNNAPRKLGGLAARSVRQRGYRPLDPWQLADAPIAVTATGQEVVFSEICFPLGGRFPTPLGEDMAWDPLHNFVTNIAPGYGIEG